ncbi:transglycosylase SLT domain-containing protein [Rhizobium sp. CFBP 8762]|uniref:lytic transglycosylase domain-containing protein n=1 Tax=Rhizobium sp. CFBP 8762 TaxID=2775279 RepID=UPI00177CF192|nr:transglycosylase SLT domain-containing protein [Rhizobium sp. CFBP 8762]MBD8554831.1 transglycosylase SLT domain-containing protein [Rhizobium sp. CFBP 8762]
MLFSSLGIAHAKGPDRTIKTSALPSATRTIGFPMPSPTPRISMMHPVYSPMIVKHAQANGIPAALAQAVVRVESNFNVRARGSQGEIGLMQIKPATARMLGYRGSIKGLYDPETNIRYGMKYLALAHDLGGGTTCGTILKYNAGHAASRMNPISKRYCNKVLQLLN